MQTFIAPLVFGVMVLCGFLALVNEPVPEPSSSVEVQKRVRVLLVSAASWLVGLIGLVVLALRAVCC